VYNIDNLPNILKELKELKKITQKEMAKKAGMSESLLSLIMSGKRPATRTQAMRIQEKLNVKIYYRRKL